MNDMISAQEQAISEAMDLDDLKLQIANLLEGNAAKTEAFKTRMIQLSSSEGLKGCTPQSIIKVGVQALTLNLSLQFGQGYVVKYKTEAQLDIGYKGWKLLADRSGFETAATPVFNCDEFRVEGVGFSQKIHFVPEADAGKRTPSDDKWARDELRCVIVSYRPKGKPDEENHEIVDRQMILKVMGMSKTNTSGTHSPYMNWFVQMAVAKALKMVLSKMAIDLSEASQLGTAFSIVNETESNQQKAGEKGAPPEFPAERFDELFPQYENLVRSGTKTASRLLNQLSAAYSLTDDQTDRLMGLRSLEAIEGESTQVNEAANANA